MSCNFCGHVGPVDVSNDFGTSKFQQKPQQQQRKKKKPPNSEDLVNHLEQVIASFFSSSIKNLKF